VRTTAPRTSRTTSRRTSSRALAARCPPAPRAPARPVRHRVRSRGVLPRLRRRPEGLHPGRQPAPRLGSVHHLDARRLRQPREGRRARGLRQPGRQARRARDDPIGISNLILFADLAATVSGAAAPFDVNDLYETANLAGRWDIVLAGFELGLSTYLGASVQNQYGFDFSGRLLGFDLYGELGLAFPDEGEDFSYAYSLGLQRSSASSTTGPSPPSSSPTARERATPRATPPSSSRATSPVLRRGVLRLRRGHPQEHRQGRHQRHAGGFANFSDLSFLARLSTSVRVPGLVPFTFALSWAGAATGRSSRTSREQLAERRAARELRVLKAAASWRRTPCRCSIESHSATRRPGMTLTK